MSAASEIYGLEPNPNKIFLLQSNVGIDGSFVAENWRGSSVKSSILLYLKEASALTFSYKNNYNLPLEEILQKAGNTGQKIMDLLTQANAVASTFNASSIKSQDNTKLMSKYQKLPAWVSTDTIVLPNTLSFDFAFGQAGLFNGLEEVVKPIIQITSLFAPDVAKGILSNGPLPLSGSVLAGAMKSIMTTGASAIAGQSASSSSSGSTAPAAANDGSLLDAAFQKAAAIVEGYNRSVQDSYGKSNCPAICAAKLGSISIPPFVVEGVEWSFNFDQVDDRGYPFQGTVRLTGCKSVIVANKTTIKGMVK